ncbi:CCA-adding enzyme [Listeria welshimeri]|nr:CCA-adding enzyme [Listeria welshimeri]
MAIEIKSLKNPDGTKFFPQTHKDAILDLVIATYEVDGIMAANDKEKLDKIQNEAEKNNVTSIDIANWNAKQDAILLSENGNKFRIIVTNNGDLKAVQL